MLSLADSGQTKALRLLLAVLAATSLAACSGGSKSSGGAGGKGSGESLADVIRIDAAVDAREKGADFRSVADRVPVAVGDAVRTDLSGFAEIAYYDGSRTRLDVNTEFEVLELSNDPGHAIARTRMGLGRTWNRVESVGSGDSFSVETSVATATVRGTAFAIACPAADTCTFTVVEGQLTLTLTNGATVDLTAPASVTVTAATASPPASVPFDVAFGDAWVLDNATRDAGSGFADAASIYQKLGPSLSSLQGGFDVNRTVRSCTGNCSGQPPVGDVAQRHFDFAVDCSKGFPCVGTVTFEHVRNQQVVSSTKPLTFDGATYTWSVAVESGSCGFDDNGDGVWDREVGRQIATNTYTIQPTAAEIRNGKWVTTAVAGTGVTVTTMLKAGQGCPDPGGRFEVSLKGNR